MNVLMVLSDQHNATLMGCAGHPQVKTPNFDRLASEGVRFTNAYTQNTICTPSRVSILSGQYCHNHGIYGLSGPAPLSLNNLMRHFKQHGYRTAAYGKLHLPNDPKNWLADDLDCFGDTYETPDGHIGDSDYFKYLEEHGVRHLEDSWHNAEHYGNKSITQDSRPSDLDYEHTQEVWCAREAMSFIKENKEKPFCIQIALQRPHHPLIPNQRFWDLYSDDLDLPETANLEPTHRAANFKKSYANFHNMKWDFTDLGEGWEKGAKRAWRGTLACVSQVDDVFGMLLDFLEQENLADDTIVIYGTDHGCYHSIHGISEKAPGICSDAVCHVPMIWRVPGITKPGTECNALVENIDMVPTLTALCKLPEIDSVDGLDISTLLTGEQQPVHDVAVTENALCKSVRWAKWRYVHYPNGYMPDHEDFAELYDIENDPNETNNLYFDDNYKEILIQSRYKLLNWLITTTRVTTTHPAISTCVDGSADFRINGTKGKFSYPVSGDGRAPKHLQPRFRDDLHEMYM